MARVVAAEDDVLVRALLVDALRGLGHEVLLVNDADALLLAVERSTVDVIIASGHPGPTDVVKLSAALNFADVRPPLIALCAATPEATERLRDTAIAAVAPLPVHPDTIGAALKKALSGPTGTATLPDAWSGAGALAELRGPVERVSPIRLLFLAHRVGATGRLVADPARTGSFAAFTVGLRAGRVVHVSGVAGLVAPLVPDAPQDADLSDAMAAAVQAGADASTAFGVAASVLADHLARLADARGGDIRFDTAWTPPAGAFPLPDAVPGIVLAGLRRMRQPEFLTRLWSARNDQVVRVHLPTDAPEARWGLDAPALRVLREASRGGSPEDLLVRVAGTDEARRKDALRALDALHVFGLIELQEAPMEAPPGAPTVELARPTTDVRARPPTGEAPRPSTAEAERAAPTAELPKQTAEDPRVDRFRDTLARLEKCVPVEILELSDKRRLTDEDIATAYREVSKRYHPDLYFNAPPAVRSLAEACFSRVNAAHEALRAPGGIAEARRFLDAKASGQPYVSEKDHQAARVAFRRGEIAFRNREWKPAYDDFSEAARLDAVTWPHALLAAHAGYLAKALTLEQAVTGIDALTTTTPQRKAEALVVTATLLKLAGKNDPALKRFKAALDADPDNRDAQRELRLVERRSAPEAPAQSGVAGILAGLLNRKK